MYIIISRNQHCSLYNNEILHFNRIIYNDFNTKLNFTIVVILISPSSANKFILDYLTVRVAK